MHGPVNPPYVFGPDSLFIIGSAYDMAMLRIGPQKREIEEQIAKAILQAAHIGERHPWRLAEAGLATLLVHV